MIALNGNLVSISLDADQSAFETTEVVRSLIGAESNGINGDTDVSYSCDSLISALNSNFVTVMLEADESTSRDYSGGMVMSGCANGWRYGPHRYVILW